MNKEKHKGFQPFVSIITLNWNNLDLTLQFLESCRQITYPNFEILVCDMNSDLDPTETILAGNFPNTKVLKSPKNLGWGPGNNWGIKQAKGEFYFVVNNDTEITPDLLEILLHPFSDDSSIGITCPKIKYFHNPDVIQYAGFLPINSFTGRNKSVGSHEIDKGQYDQSYFTFSAHGCAMMIKRSVLAKVGMFPEKFFIYYDEMDLSARVIKAGYKILYEGKGVIYHKESMSMGKKSSLKTYYLTRNRILYMRRNSTILQYFCFMTFFILVSTPKAATQFLIEKKFDHLKSFFKGIAWNMKESKFSVQ